MLTERDQGKDATNMLLKTLKKATKTKQLPTRKPHFRSMMKVGACRAQIS